LIESLGSRTLAPCLDWPDDDVGLRQGSQDLALARSHLLEHRASIGQTLLATFRRIRIVEARVFSHVFEQFGERAGEAHPSRDLAHLRVETRHLIEPELM
jgi:hypothetical protein